MGDYSIPNLWQYYSKEFSSIVGEKIIVPIKAIKRSKNTEDDILECPDWDENLGFSSNVLLEELLDSLSGGIWEGNCRKFLRSNYLQEEEIELIVEIEILER